MKNLKEQKNKNIIEKLNKIENKLISYVEANYDLTKNKISRKLDHILKTRLVSDEISTSLKLSDRNLYLSSLIALFHDFGRFEQAKIYDSFNDKTTIDHADFSVDLLFDKSYILNFVDDLSPEELEIMKLAIKYHNKFAVPQGLSKRQEMFCKIIRDADKVDIYRVVSINPHFDSVKECDLKESDLEEFFNHKLSVTKANPTFYNSVISKLCFLYDINYKKSYEILLRENYITNYKNALIQYTPFKIDEKIFECFEYIQKYIEKQINK